MSEPASEARIRPLLRELCKKSCNDGTGFVDDLFEALREARGGPPARRALELPDALLADEIPVDALGWAHEQNLEPGQRKKNGAFYTPAAAVDYILQASLHESMRVVDPACGGGAFLLRVYRGLLDRQPGSSAQAVLDRQVVGVDLDPASVTVARRSLELMALEARGEEVDATASVRVGDALRPDCWRDVPAFDLVVGNPPYQRELGARETLAAVASTDLARHRRPRMDLWYYFVHRGLGLLRPGGVLSFVVSAYWTSGRGASGLVESLRSQARLDELFLLEDRRLFEGLGGRHLIMRVVKEDDPDAMVTIKSVVPGAERDAAPFLAGAAPVRCIRRSASKLFTPHGLDLEASDPAMEAAWSRGTPLSDLGIVRQGIAENPAVVNPRTNARFDGRWTVGEGVFSLTPAELAALNLDAREAALVRDYHALADIRPYVLGAPSRRLLYSTRGTCPTLEGLDRLRGHLERFAPIMNARRETRRGRVAWWHLHWPRDERLWRADKIVALQMARRPTFAAAFEPTYVPFSANVFVPSPELPEHLDYLVAVLSSSILHAWFRRHAKRRGVGLEINGRVLAAAPVIRVDFTCPRQREIHDGIVERVQRLRRGGGPDGSLEAEIDDLVRDLFSHVAPV